MKILKIQGKNFWSYSDIEFDFDKGLCLIEGYNADEQGSNGSGKSAFLNSVCFALFGDLPKSIKIDEVINKVVGSACLIELELEDNGSKYRVIRGRSPNVLKFFINEEQVSDVDAKKTQKLIEQTLGITYSIFVNSVYFAQSSSNFLVASDEQKKTILTELLNLKVFDKAEDLVRSKLKSIESGFLSIKSKIDSDSRLIQSLQSQLVDLKTQSKFYKDEQSKKFENIEKEYSKVSLDLDNSKNRLVELESLRPVFCSELQNFLDVEKKSKIEALETIENERKELNDKLIKIQVSLQYEKTQLQKYCIDDPKCPKCFQDVDFNLLSGHKEEAEQKIQSIQSQIGDINVLMGELPSKIDTAQLKSKLQTKEQDLNNSINQVDNEFRICSSNISNLKSRLESLDKSRNQAVSEENPYSNMIEDVNSRITTTTSSLDELTKSSQEVGKEVDELLFLKEVFSNKGIKSYVFDTIVNELNVRVNGYLSKLFDNNVRMMFLSETTNSKGDTKQSFSTQFLVNNNEVALGSFSGGEERRLVFAVNLSMADIIANRSNKSFNIAFFDEVFDGLDIEGKSKCMSLLQELSSKRDCILIIDHASEFQQAFDNVIRVEKRNGISKIV